VRLTDNGRLGLQSIHLHISDIAAEVGICPVDFKGSGNLKKRAKRLDCVRLSGAFVRTRTLGKWKAFVRSHSSAEVAAIQTLRDQRMLQSSFDFQNTLHDCLAGAGQPWAELCNPVGIGEKTNFVPTNARGQKQFSFTLFSFHL